MSGHRARDLDTCALNIVGALVLVEIDFASDLPGVCPRSLSQAAPSRAASARPDVQTSEFNDNGIQRRW
jgi:hypothetical protein